MADVKAKPEQEEMDHQTEQENVVMNNNTGQDNAPSSDIVPLVNAEVGGQNDNIFNNNIGSNNGDINSDMWWELEDINRMDTLTANSELLGGGGGWEEWKHDEGDKWDFSTVNNNYEDNDWVIDDLWVFDNDHQDHNPNTNNGGDATNPRDPKA